ncbi:MAG: hypothetical protein E7420_04395 [Ruminococcaceae bacterium]|nr:hypothetical protein [Oscillospiraceae bacterium]
MNIILTGPKHCGKSTLIKKVINKYTGRISGFISEFDDRSSSCRQLHIRSIIGEENACAVKWENGNYTVDFEIFDKFAPGLIDFNSDLIIIDELGKFEASCENLRRTVEKAFSSSVNLIAVLRLDAPAWINDLKQRSDTIVINVNFDNRESLADDITMLFNHKNNVEYC